MRRKRSVDKTWEKAMQKTGRSHAIGNGRDCGVDLCWEDRKLSLLF